LAAQAAGAFDTDAVETMSQRPGDQVGVAGWVVGEAGLGEGPAVSLDGTRRQGVFVRSMPMKCTWACYRLGWLPGAAHTCVDPGRAAPIKRHHPAWLPGGPSNGKPQPGRARRCLRHSREQAKSNTHIVLLGQDRADQPQDRRPIGEDPDHIGPPADLPVDPSSGLVERNLNQCSAGRAEKASRSASASSSSQATLGAWGRSWSAIGGSS
jgi:hypothetical protein